MLLFRKLANEDKFSFVVQPNYIFPTFNIITQHPWSNTEIIQLPLPIKNTNKYKEIIKTFNGILYADISKITAQEEVSIVNNFINFVIHVRTIENFHNIIQKINICDKVEPHLTVLYYQVMNILIQQRNELNNYLYLQQNTFTDSGYNSENECEDDVTIQHNNVENMQLEGSESGSTLHTNVVSENEQCDSSAIEIINNFINNQFETDFCENKLFEKFEEKNVDEVNIVNNIVKNHNSDVLNTEELKDKTETLEFEPVSLRTRKQLSKLTDSN